MARSLSRMGHRRLPLRVLVAIVLFAAACGDDDDAAVSGELDGEQVEVAAVWSGTEQDRFSAVLEAFEERTGATVQFTSTGDDIATVLGTRLAGGDPPDVAILPQPGLLTDLARQGAIQPLPEAAADLVEEHYDKVWRDLALVEGRPSGVWFKASNKSTLWFNRTVLTDAGVEPPTTWEELKSAAQAVADFGVTPFSVAGADGWTLTDWFENIYLRTAGPDNYSDLARHHLAWTDPTVTEALETLAEVFRSDWLTGGAAGALQTGFTDSVAAVYAEPPQAAFVFEGDFVAGVISAETEAVLGEEADFVDFPSIDGSPPSVVAGGDVAVLLDDTPGGRALVEFLATPEAAAEWAGQGGFLSPNEGLDVDVYPTELEARAAEALLEAEALRFDMSDLQPAAFGATTGQGLWKLFQDFLAGPGNAGALAGQMEDAAVEVFEP